MKLAPNFGTRQAWLWRNRGAFGEQITGEKPRLLVDVSAIMRHDAQTGIQRVVRAVWAEIFRRSSSGFDALPVFATGTHGYCYAPMDFLCRTSTLAEPKTVRVRRGDRFLGLDLSAHLLPKYRRQLRAWRAHEATVHLIVYDLLPLSQPDWFTPSAVSNFRKWLSIVAKEADQALCISDHVAGELRRILRDFGGARLPRIGRLQMGADIAASLPSSGIPETATQALEALRHRQFILMVGTAEPRKGYEAAISAFDHLWRRMPADAPDLVIVGKAGWKTSELQARIRSHPQFGARLQWFNGLSDEGLHRLYDSCRGLLVASRGEGWGLPLIEAAMHRRHVLARDLPVFREHGLPNISYFTDDSPEALGRRVIELMNRGRTLAPAAKLPSWSDCVDGLLDAMGIASVGETHVEPPLRRAS